MGWRFWFSNPSGGWYYHLRAWRFGRSLWRPFNIQVKNWLNFWNPQTNTLIVFGPSAGYSVSPDFIHRFQKIILIEPDRWAKLFSTWPKDRTVWIHDEQILFNALNGNAEKLQNLLQQYPSAAILFSNVLGQLNLFNHGWMQPHSPSIRKLLQTLSHHKWASYHDVLSSRTPPDRFPQEKMRPAKLEDLTAKIWNAKSKNIVVVDHGTWWLKSRLPLAHWQFTHHYHHLVAFVTSDDIAALV